jgi:uncharacterized protein (DUF58 family)
MASHAYGAMLDALRSTRWGTTARPRVPLAGAHVARRVTPSAEVTEYRLYRQGDEPRRIDWKVLARTDRAYVRLAPDATVTPTLLLLDASASMAADAPAKWEMARALAVGLACTARNAGDPVGVLSSAARVPISARGDVVRSVIGAVDAMSPTGASVLAPTVGDLRGVMRIAVISDFLGDDAEPLRSAAASWRAHGMAVHAIHVVARREVTLDEGIALARDPERPEVLRPMRRAERAAYASAFQTFRTELAASWRAAGAQFHDVLDDASPADCVRRIARGRA